MLMLLVFFAFCFMFCELRSETEILHKLLNMVYEYKAHVHDEKLSSVENAILEMRLQRINFSGSR